MRRLALCMRSDAECAVLDTLCLYQAHAPLESFSTVTEDTHAVLLA